MTHMGMVSQSHTPYWSSSSVDMVISDSCMRNDFPHALRIWDRTCYHDHGLFRDHSVYAPCQWGMALQCNAIAHWLGAYTEWSLIIIYCQKYHALNKLTPEIQSHIKTVFPFTGIIFIVGILTLLKWHADVGTVPMLIMKTIFFNFGSPVVVMRQSYNNLGSTIKCPELIRHLSTKSSLMDLPQQDYWCDRYKT